ncbi:MAG: TlpA family protein disulfide reductase [Gammaproteobacteria bacterium]|nr:TlpA family protein disulfide reductase [Gammaproteobacteria bacterium]
MQNTMPRTLIYLFIIAISVILTSCRSDVTPETTFSTITGQKIVLSELRDKPVIVTFWATDCASCLKEIPHLIELYRQYHEQGLEIIAVAMAYDPPNHVIELSQAQQLPYHVALDLQAENAHAFGDVSLTPTTFLIAPDGTIILQKTGLFDMNEMKAQLSTFIKG